MMDFIKRVLNPNLPEGGVRPDWTGVHQPSPVVAPPSVDAALLRREARIVARRRAEEVESQRIAAQKAQAEREALLRYDEKRRLMADYNAAGKYLSTKEDAGRVNSAMTQIGAPIRIGADYGRSLTNEYDGDVVANAADAKLYEDNGFRNRFPGDTTRSVEPRMAAVLRGRQQFVSDEPGQFSLVQTIGDSRPGKIIPEYSVMGNPFYAHTNAHPRGAFAEAAWASRNPSEAARRYNAPIESFMNRVLAEPSPDPPRRPRKR